MKKKKDISGLIFSAFLVIAFVICSYFFTGLINSATAIDETVRNLLVSLVFVVFGLVLFYATRVGDGKQIKRFSLAALILIDLPALYIILASAARGIPFPFDMNDCTEMVRIAAVALGYGIPYTFLSGYELDIPDDNETEDEEAGIPVPDGGDIEESDDISDVEEKSENDDISENDSESDGDRE